MTTPVRTDDHPRSTSPPPPRVRRRPPGFRPPQRALGVATVQAPVPGHAPRLRVVVHVAALLVVVAALTAPAAAGPPPAAPPTEPAPRGFVLPLPGRADVLRAFERPPAPWAAGHRGVDLAAVVGGDVLAPGDGVVTFAGRVAGRPLVTMALAGGLLSSVEPVVPDVTAGDQVTGGALVGSVAAAGGHCDQPCVHWGVRAGRSDPPVYLDPMTLLGGAGPIVLLPEPPIPRRAAWPDG